LPDFSPRVYREDMLRGLRLSMRDVDPILDRTERSLVERALAWLRDRQPRASSGLWAQVKRIAVLGATLDETPSLFLPSTMGARTRDETTLIAELAQLDPMGGELALPEKALTSRAFLVAKIGLLGEFRTALEPGAPGAEPTLHDEFVGELGQSIYTLMATEILIGLLGDGELDMETKLRAARQLVLIWDRAVQLEIDDFCPLLEAAWRARSRLAVHFGALLGVGEYLRLANQDCPSEFLEFFSRDEASDGELAALEEFLFNLPFEDLGKLRAAMRAASQAVCDGEFARRVLGRPIDDSAAVDDPEALYRSYRRRRAAAEYRRLIGAPGPLRVAEAHIMTYVLGASAARP
jgi:hypothetical protein